MAVCTGLFIQTRIGACSDGSHPLSCERGNSRGPHRKEVLFAMQGIKQQECGQSRTLWWTLVMDVWTLDRLENDT